MSDERVLIAELRTEDFGSAGSRRIVRAGRIPAVIYGKNAPKHISLDAHDFLQKLKYFSETTILTITIGKETHDVLLKAYQEDYVRGVIRHIDFFEITKGQTLRANVAIVLHGNAIGVRNGGVLELLLPAVEIEALPKDLPESLTLDVENLDLNESLRVADLPETAGVKILTDPEAAVAIVKAVKETAEAAETEEGEVAEASQE